MTNNYPKTTIHPPSSKAYIVDSSKPVIVEQREMLAVMEGPEHDHPRGQFIWARSGLFSIISDHRMWLVPSTCAIWIPGGTRHQLSGETDTELVSLYVDPFYDVLPAYDHAVALKLTTLMKEVMLRLVDRAISDDDYVRLLGLVVLEELSRLDETDYWLPSGRDPRLKKLLNILVNDFSEDHKLAVLAARIGASPRTIERLFVKETGLTFRQWKSHYKLMKAKELLEKGATTKFAAHSVGYKSVTSFIQEFCRLYGCTPQEYGAQIHSPQ